MKALITGGAGFIGSHLIRALTEDSNEVVVLDDFSTGRRENIEAILPRISLIEGTITDIEVCREACAGVDVVFHQAAIPSVPRSFADPLTSHSANATGTLNMLVAAKDEGVSRFVAAASSSAYGDTPTLPKVETMRPTPMSPYSAQKYLLELYCAQFHRLFGLETFALRYFNIFGPRQDPNSPYGAVVPKFISALFEDTAPLIHGDGEQSRDFTYIDNAVQANLLAARAPAETAGQVFNVACGDRFTVNELLAALQKIIGVDRAPIHQESRAGDVKHSLADISRAQKHLGYRVLVDFSEGLAKTVDWYRSHP